MSAQISSLTIAAPGFKGINTQDSPLNDDFAFASVANNCVIDNYGRVGSRKGFKTVTSSLSPLGSSAGLEAVGHFLDSSSNTEILSGGNNKIFKGTSTLTELSLPGGYSVSANNWKIINFYDSAYFFQQGYEPLVYSNSAGLQKMSAVTSAAGTPPQANEVLGAYGRLWAADFAADKATVYWSDLVSGHKWTGGSSGSINISHVWPDGYDEIVALAAWNGYLIIFGSHSIVTYSGATTPASMTLSDTISGVGCLTRDTVQSTGTDLLFLSSSGLLSLGRTIQEKSLPINTVSGNITNDLLYKISSESNNKVIKSIYSPEEKFYLLIFPSSDMVYCFDTSQALENGAYRVTTWSSSAMLNGTRTLNGTLYFSGSSAITEYSGFIDGTSTEYDISYFSNELAFGNTTQLKMLKEITALIVGGQNSSATMNWSYDFTENYFKQVVSIADAVVGEYGVSEYNSTAEYTGGVVIEDPTVKTSGQGRTLRIGLEAPINGNALSLQQFNIKALIGKSL